jgi:hypothetical protein
MNIGSLCSKEERRKIKDALACLVLRADPVRDGNAAIAIYVHKSVLKFSSVSGLYLSPGGEGVDLLEKGLGCTLPE